MRKTNRLKRVLAAFLATVMLIGVLASCTNVPNEGYVSTTVSTTLPSGQPDNTPETFTVVFKDYDGSLLKEEKVEKGKSATAPPDPIRAGYVFKGWSIPFDNITANIVVIALYEIESDSSAAGCNHSMTAIASKAATCTEPGNIAYWRCTMCNKYFNDAVGIDEISLSDTVVNINSTNHANVVSIPMKAPTDTEWGYEAGSECKACNTIIIEPKPISPLGDSNYHIVYDLDNNLTGHDEYIQNWVLNNTFKNPNPTTSPKDKDLTLIRIGVENYPEIPGYSFVGWYDSIGNPVSFIPAGTQGTVYIYAKWQQKQYTVTLYKNKEKNDSEKITDTYTVDKGYTLNPIDWNHYLFVAWTDLEGNVIKEIKPGSVGDIKLVANWTSERNQTVPEKNIDKPLLIYEDQENEKFFFTYKVGTIINAPLYVIKNFGNTMGSGINVKYTDSTTGVVTKEQANSLSDMISKATTESGSWTLSEEWNEKTSISEKHKSEVSKEVIEEAVENRNTTGSWNVSSYNEGKDEAVVGTDTYAKVEASMKAGIGVGPYKVEAGLSSEMGSNVTTETSSMRYWNTNEAYSNSYNNNTTDSFTNALKTAIVNEIGSTQEKGHNVLNSSTTEVGKSTEQARQYTSELVISTGTTEATAIEFSSDANTPRGYYRYVAAGTIHVYAVVSYDVATSTYFTYTYNVLDDKIAGYLDYSTSSDYDDYQNGVLPFEIPVFVNDYINDRLTGSVSLSDWVLSTNVPQGAQIVSEKWTYNLTTHITSDKLYVEGYKLISSEWGKYGEWSAWQRAIITETDAIKVEKRQMNSFYYYLCMKCGHHNFSQGNCKNCRYYVSDSIEGVWNEAYFNVQWTNASSYTINGQIWYQRSDGNGPSYYEYRYCTRERIYYHQKIETMESTTVVAETESISNIQKWVKYIIT